MVRYPFDLLRAVSQVEPLTMNGKSKDNTICNPFALRFIRLRRRQRRPGYRRGNGKRCRVPKKRRLSWDFHHL